MSLDLNSLSVKELRDLQVQVVRAIATFEDRARKAAAAALEDLAKAHGFTLSDFTGAASVPKKRAPAGAKFANPADKSQTWSGRGRKPHWYIAAIAAGKSPDDLSV
jgi:DNA-binding protein H-NS